MSSADQLCIHPADKVQSGITEYEGDSNQMWATLCREQINLNYRIAGSILPELPA